MGIYEQTSEMTMPQECFCFVYALVQRVVTLFCSGHRLSMEGFAKIARIGNVTISDRQKTARTVL
jgi:hypothetical protein